MKSFSNFAKKLKISSNLSKNYLIELINYSIILITCELELCIIRSTQSLKYFRMNANCLTVPAT